MFRLALGLSLIILTEGHPLASVLGVLVLVSIPVTYWLFRN